MDLEWRVRVVVEFVKYLEEKHGKGEFLRLLWSVFLAINIYKFFMSIQYELSMFSDVAV